MRGGAGEEPIRLLCKAGRGVRLHLLNPSYFYSLYTPKLKYAVEDIEAAIGNPFEWRGAPQPCDVLRLCAEGHVEALGEVDPDLYPYLISTARRVIASLGAENAVCAALACLCGARERPKVRSLLASEEGMVTWMYHSGKVIDALGHVFGKSTCNHRAASLLASPSARHVPPLVSRKRTFYKTKLYL